MASLAQRYMSVPAWTVLVIAALASAACAVEVADFSGYQVFRVTPDTEEDARELMTILAESRYDIWREWREPGDSTDVMVSPEEVQYFKDVLIRFNSTLIINNVQALIDGRGNFGRVDIQQSSAFGWNNYYSIDSINAWLKEKAKGYEDIATLVSAGNSTEGRQILGLRIAHKPNLPIVVIEAGIHAREWISTATATWFIRAALDAQDSVLTAYEWHVFPSVNPDGYAYTRVNRLWRKNRKNTFRSFFGVDLNRNYPFEWQDIPHPELETFPGFEAASEVETQGFMAYLDNILHRTRVYISLHSYSQLLMYPWGYTTELPENYVRLGEIANKAATEMLNVDSLRFKHGPIATTVYPATGNTIDYVYSRNVTYPFVFELPDTGKYGFMLPARFIVPTGKATLDGLTVILKEALKP